MLEPNRLRDAHRDDGDDDTDDDDDVDDDDDDVLFIVFNFAPHAIVPDATAHNVINIRDPAQPTQRVRCCGAGSACAPSAGPDGQGVCGATFEPDHIPLEISADCSGSCGASDRSCGLPTLRRR